ncbi:MAG: sulfotransferase domain-containing protein [Candidatus Nitrosocaldaceae archaeon]
MNDTKPNLFVVGFSKAGTTALVDYLIQHTSIFAPWQKEPHALTVHDRLPSWFNTRYNMGKFDMKSYLLLYKDAAKYRYRIDGSTSYTYDPIIAHKIKEFNTHAKIFMCIRNQKERLVSAYLYTYLTHMIKDFSIWIDRYFIPEMNSFLMYDKICEYYKVFGDNMIVIENNLLKNKPQEVLNSIFKFLDLETINIQVIYRNPSMVTPNDSALYRYSMFVTYYIIMKIRNGGKNLLLEKLSRKVIDSVRYRFVKNIIEKKAKSSHKELINMIPTNIANILEDDYLKTLEFIENKGISINKIDKMT